MTQDPVAFRRATAVSLVGLLIQSAATLALLLYGALGADHVAVSGFLYTAVGLLVWITLALLFHQHRLERLEAAESEALSARGGAASSIFDEAAQEMQVAARRLAWMHRVLTPAVSLLISGLLILFGALRALDAQTLLGVGEAQSAQPGWGIALGVVIAAASFIFARFVAGMAGHEVWALLRGGASTGMGVALIAAALALAHALNFGGFAWLLEALHIAVPIAMIALGAEILLNFLLNLYRPRKAGEVPRPAFDSRVLSLLAAPDRIAETISEAINYQFGFDVSSTWFYRLLSRWTLSLTALAALALWGLTTLAVVQPNERGLILASGELSREVGPGLHVKQPWPIGSIIRRPALAANTLRVAQEPLEADAPVIWTEPHVAGQEQYLIVRAGDASSPDRDIALLGADLVLTFEVVDLEKFYRLAADAPDPADRDALRRRALELVARREFMLEMGSRSVDEALGADRLETIAALRDRLERAFDALNVDPATGEPTGSGVRILHVGVVGVHPPSEAQVAQSFHQVVEAQQRREAAISRAQAEKVRTLTRTVGDVALAERVIAALDQLEALTAQGADERAVAAQEQAIEALLDAAGGDAAALIAQARAERWEEHMSAWSRVVRQRGRSLTYQTTPSVYTAMLYLDAIREAVRDARVFITAFDASRFQINFEQMQPNIDPFDIRRADQPGQNQE